MHLIKYQNDKYRNLQTSLKLKIPLKFRAFWKVNNTKSRTFLM